MQIQTYKHTLFAGDKLDLALIGQYFVYGPTLILYCSNKKLLSRQQNKNKLYFDLKLQVNMKLHKRILKQVS